MIMSPEHPEWKKFVELLQGEEGCNFREDKERGVVWRCGGGYSKVYATDILTRYFPDIDMDETLAYFEAHGGHCDCEILFNVDE